MIDLNIGREAVLIYFQTFFLKIVIYPVTYLIMAFDSTLYYDFNDY